MKSDTIEDDSSKDPETDAAENGLVGPGLGEHYHFVEGSEAPIIEVEFRHGDCNNYDSFVIPECPVCSKEHEFSVVPEVVLGGLREIRAPCGSRTSLDSFFVVLQDPHGPIPAEIIHGARDKLLDRQGELRDPLIPIGIDPRAVTDSTVPINLE